MLNRFDTIPERERRAELLYQYRALALSSTAVLTRDKNQNNTQIAD